MTVNTNGPPYDNGGSLPPGEQHERVREYLNEQISAAAGVPGLSAHRPISEHHHAGQLCPLGSGCVQPSGPEPLLWPFTGRWESDTPREPVDPDAVYSWRAADGSTVQGPYPPGYVDPRPFNAGTPAPWQSPGIGHGIPPAAVAGQPYPYANTLSGGVQVNVTAPRAGVNHGLHLVLTLITCGAWAPVWIVLAIIDAARGR